MHGKTSAIHHAGEGLFDGLPNPLHRHPLSQPVRCARETPADGLEVTAWTDDGEIMGLPHRDPPGPRRAVPPRSPSPPRAGISCSANFLDAGRRQALGRGLIGQGRCPTPSSRCSRAWPTARRSIESRRRRLLRRLPARRADPGADRRRGHRHAPARRDGRRDHRLRPGDAPRGARRSTIPTT